MNRSAREAQTPRIGKLSPFLVGLSEGALSLSTCSVCGDRYLPPRDVCESCGSRSFSWTASRGSGRVWSKVEFHRQYLPDRDVPYTVVLVKLDDGGFVYGRASTPYDDIPVGALVDFQPEQSAAGAPVFELRRIS